MRENKRYLLISGENLRENVPRAIKDFIGVLGMSKTCLEFIRSGNNSTIISVNRESLNHVRASFAVWPEKIGVLRVSGTLKGLGKK